MQATRITFKLEGDENLSCHNVTYFNGKYRFFIKDGNEYNAIEETVDIDVYCKFKIYFGRIYLCYSESVVAVLFFITHQQ